MSATPEERVLTVIVALLVAVFIGWVVRTCIRETSKTRNKYTRRRTDRGYLAPPHQNCERTPDWKRPLRTR